MGEMSYYWFNSDDKAFYQFFTLHNPKTIYLQRQQLGDEVETLFIYDTFLL